MVMSTMSHRALSFSGALVVDHLDFQFRGSCCDGGPMLHQHVVGVAIELHPVRPVRLRPGERRAVRPLDDVPRFRLHDLRHFMATQMLAAGVPIVTVSQRLSHARVSTTLNVYAHSVPGGDRKGAEMLAGIPSAGRRGIIVRPRDS
jgi:hypothetical protein